MAMNAKQLDKWAQTRQIGRKAYIWRMGVLGWGIVTGFAWSIAMAASQGWNRLPLLLPIALILFPIGGYFVGAFTWKMTEADYLKQRPE